MLYHLLYPLHTEFSVFYVFRFITFRTIYAAITALVISFLLGPWLIEKLSSLQLEQTIRRLGPESHFKKEGTPTMGGSLILFAIVLPTLLWADLTNMYVWLVLLVTVGYGVIGFVDDLLKIRKKNSDGLSPRKKMFWPPPVGTSRTSSVESPSHRCLPTSPEVSSTTTAEYSWAAPAAAGSWPDCKPANANNCRRV